MAVAICWCIFLYLLFISKIEPVGVRLNLTPMGRDQLGPYHPLRMVGEEITLPTATPEPYVIVSHHTALQCMVICY